MEEIEVEKAAEIIDSVRLDTTFQEVPLEDAIGKVLQEPLVADRDLPPFDRIMMDGIAIRYEQWEKGREAFQIKGIQKAGADRQVLDNERCCLEVMTGAILPGNTDTVIRYEDIEIQQRNGSPVALVKKGPESRDQNVHARGTNRKKNDLLISQGTILGTAEIGVAATVGKSTIKVSDPPNVAVVSTGDELVEINEQPLPHQIRRSNAYTLSSALKTFGIDAGLFHFNDNRKEIYEKLRKLLDRFELLILSGGVSKGKLDYIPGILEQSGVEKLFHRVNQRPGKPFWFGKFDGGAVFALPGNPVSSFVCYYRYILPWLKNQMGITNTRQLWAQLSEDFFIDKPLTYFLQVKIVFNNDGILTAVPVRGKGSSDLANLCLGDGFLELPVHQDRFSAGESYPLYLYRSLC